MDSPFWDFDITVTEEAERGRCAGCDWLLLYVSSWAILRGRPLPESRAAAGAALLQQIFLRRQMAELLQHRGKGRSSAPGHRGHTSHSLLLLMMTSLAQLCRF